MLEHFRGDVRGKSFAVWGLAFKPRTDDMRDAPSRVVVQGLLDAGARVQAYDPEAMASARQIFGEGEDFMLCDSRDDAIAGADALVICTEWRQFKSPDWEALRRELTDKVIFDGRNIYDPDRVKREGLTYIGIGLGEQFTDSGRSMRPGLNLLAEVLQAD